MEGLTIWLKLNDAPDAISRHNSREAAEGQEVGLIIEAMRGQESHRMEDTAGVLACQEEHVGGGLPGQEGPVQPASR